MVPDKGELQTKPDVAHITGIGEKNPERLIPNQIRSLRGEVLRHNERRKAGK